MKRSCLRLIRALLALSLALCMVLPASADGMPDDSPLVFSDGRFSAGAGIRGFFVTAVPAEDQAVLCLGERPVQPGDAIPAQDLPRLRLIPAADAEGEASLCFLPVGPEGPGAASVLTMHIQSKEKEAPQALDLSLETYRNIPNTGVLRAVQEGGGELRFQLASRSKRGTVDLDPDGSFTYTPKKNKVGEDSFTFLATDAEGRVSEPGTVRIRILKPTEAQTFADLAMERQFPALWLRENGLFGGEEVNGRLSFGPDREVTRGEFLTMVMAMEGIDPEIGLQRSGFADEGDAPIWMRSYLASALRRGIIRGKRTERGLCFLPNQPILAADAVGMLARVLEPGRAVPAMADGETSVLPGGISALLRDAGLSWTGAHQTLNRMEAARLLYQASLLNETE